MCVSWCVDVSIGKFVRRSKYLLELLRACLVLTTPQNYSTKTHTQTHTWGQTDRQTDISIHYNRPFHHHLHAHRSTESETDRQTHTHTCRRVVVSDVSRGDLVAEALPVGRDLCDVIQVVEVKASLFPVKHLQHRGQLNAVSQHGVRQAHTRSDFLFLCFSKDPLADFSLSLSHTIIIMCMCVYKVD